MLFSSMIIPTEVDSRSTFSSKQTEHVFCCWSSLKTRIPERQDGTRNE